jgi:RimJ/RimL family protein N-acetyltransferase
VTWLALWIPYQAQKKNVCASLPVIHINDLFLLCFLSVNSLVSSGRRKIAKQYLMQFDMTIDQNHLGQEIGHALPHWAAPGRPSPTAMNGRFCSLVPLVPAAHAESLYAANCLDRDGANWTYLPYGPFADLATYREWLDKVAASPDTIFFTILDKPHDRPVGLAAYLRIDPTMGCIEVGHLNFSPLLQQRPAATEAMFLMMQNAFSLGYRRYEWKCNALNLPSRRAAERLGFQFEGVFRQAAVVKDRNRDTAWFSVIDSEWSAVRDAFVAWLAPDNFDGSGSQHQSLSSLRERQATA